MTHNDPAAELLAQLGTSLLTPEERDEAWKVGSTANSLLKGASPVLRLEIAAYMIAIALEDLAADAKHPDQLKDVVPVGEVLFQYMLERARPIIIDRDRQRREQRGRSGRASASHFGI